MRFRSSRDLTLTLLMLIWSALSLTGGNQPAEKDGGQEASAAERGSLTETRYALPTPWLANRDAADMSGEY
jgi:hypothetical protein